MLLVAEIILPKYLRKDDCKLIIGNSTRLSHFIQKCRQLLTLEPFRKQAVMRSFHNIDGRLIHHLLVSLRNGIKLPWNTGNRSLSISEQCIFSEELLAGHGMSPEMTINRCPATTIIE